MLCAHVEQVVHATQEQGPPPQVQSFSALAPWLFLDHCWNALLALGAYRAGGVDDAIGFLRIGSKFPAFGAGVVEWRLYRTPALDLIVSSVEQR